MIALRVPRASSLGSGNCALSAEGNRENHRPATHIDVQREHCKFLMTRPRRNASLAAVRRLARFLDQALR